MHLQCVTILTKHYFLEGNQPLIFEFPQIIWLVKSGEVEIFYSLESAGELIGNRHYLFTFTLCV